MQIHDEWDFSDDASGLHIKVIKGDKLNRLHIEHTGKPMTSNRDFWFTEDGIFDGTGSVCV